MAIFSLSGKMPVWSDWFINEVKGTAIMSEMSLMCLHDIVSKPELDLCLILQIISTYLVSGCPGKIKLHFAWIA